MNQTRSKAQELLRQVDEILIDHPLFAMPWWPFRVPCDEEQKDRERARALQDLATEYEKEEGEVDTKARQQLAERLVELGGYELHDGILELGESAYRFGDQIERIRKLESLEDFLKVFDEHIARYLEDGWPNWQKLGQDLLKYQGVRPAELNDLTLMDVRRYLPLLTNVRKKRQPARPKKAVRPRVLTPIEKRVWTLHTKGRSFSEIGKELGVSRQAAHAAYRRAERVIEVVAPGGGRSVKAQSGVPAYDQRSKSKNPRDL